MVAHLWWLWLKTARADWTGGTRRRSRSSRRRRNHRRSNVMVRLRCDYWRSRRMVELLLGLLGLRRLHQGGLVCLLLLLLKVGQWTERWSTSNGWTAHRWCY